MAANRLCTELCTGIVDNNPGVVGGRTPRIGGATQPVNGRRACEESITDDLCGVIESIRFHQFHAIAERIVDVHATIAFEGLIFLQGIS